MSARYAHGPAIAERLTAWIEDARAELLLAEAHDGGVAHEDGDVAHGCDTSR